MIATDSTTTAQVNATSTASIEAGETQKNAMEALASNAAFNEAIKKDPGLLEHVPALLAAIASLVPGEEPSEEQMKYFEMFGLSMEDVLEIQASSSFNAEALLSESHYASLFMPGFMGMSQQFNSSVKQAAEDSKEEEW